MIEEGLTTAHGVSAVLLAFSTFLLLYLVNLNRLITSTPAEIKKLAGRPWTDKDIKAMYERLSKAPITTASYASQLPRKLDRRYIVTGGSGLVGGHIVLQLLERGQPPETIRIVDFQPLHRADMVTGPASRVDFRKADISSAASTDAAFGAPWPASAADLPLTVFHTAAVIIPSARSELVKAFCESVNVRGTENVLAAARRGGADVFVSTSSASIAIRPVEFWGAAPWRWNESPRHYAQVLDESDFDRPLRAHGEYFGNYPASKAKAERIVCGANGPEMRTGCIRPANGVYGHPTDNIIGVLLNTQIWPHWQGHITQSFAHGINCAVAHLQFEAILAESDSFRAPQAGRPFLVTDPNPPIPYASSFQLIGCLATTPFRAFAIPPLPMLLLSYAFEFYNLFPVRHPELAKYLPKLPGDMVYLEPGLFSICTHLVGNMDQARKPVDQGGLGYRGVLTTLEGMCQELLEWNREQEEHARVTAKLAGASGGLRSGKFRAKYFRPSLSLPDEIRKLSGMRKTVKG